MNMTSETQLTLTKKDVMWIFQSWLPADPDNKEVLTDCLIFLKDRLEKKGILQNSPEELMKSDFSDLRQEMEEWLGETHGKEIGSDFSARLFRSDCLERDTADVIQIISLMEKAAVLSGDSAHTRILDAFFDVFRVFARLSSDPGNTVSSDILHRVEERLILHLQDFLVRINDYSDGDISRFISDLETIGGDLIEKHIKEELSVSAVSILKEFAETLKDRLKERSIIGVLAYALNKKKGRIFSFPSGREFDYGIETRYSNNSLKLTIGITVGSEFRKLDVIAKVMIEKRIPYVTFDGSNDYFDLLHNYILNNQHELLESVLSLMSVVTPSNTVFYLPLSEQAKKVLYQNRMDDDSLSFLKQIAVKAGFPAEKHKHVKTKDGHFLKCEKAAAFSAP